MHEFSFARDIIRSVLRVFNETTGNKRKITRVVIVAGRLHQIVEDNLQLALRLLAADTVATEAEFELHWVDISYRCKLCGEKGIIIPPRFLCHVCGSGQLEIITGKELYLDKMEIG